MKLPSLVVAALSLCSVPLLAAEVRTWTDKTGNYTIDASLLAFDDDQVVLEREPDKQLGEIDIDQLSEADQEYLKSKEAVAASEQVTGAMQKWTLTSGLQIIGKVVEYGSREITLKRSRGKIYVNGIVYENLPPVYQKLVPLIVANAGNQVTDLRTLTQWLASRRGGPETFTVDGVLMELQNGDEYGVPLFMFSDQDRQVLEPGWKHWLSLQQQPSEENTEEQRDEAFRLQAAAAAYHQGQQQQIQIAQMQLGMQAINAGVTSLWEVTLYPGRGVAGPPLWVTEFGRDSRIATQQALARYPGYYAGPVRKVSRRN